MTGQQNISHQESTLAPSQEEEQGVEGTGKKAREGAASTLARPSHPRVSGRPDAADAAPDRAGRRTAPAVAAAPPRAPRFAMLPEEGEAAGLDALPLADLPFHPLADLFPLIEGAEFDALVADVRENGLREPIVLLDGMILDGRNRWRAAKAAGLIGCGDPAVERIRHFAAYLPDRDGPPLAFVISKNLRRRHLNESQRAFVAARLANLGVGRPAETAQDCAVSQERAAGLLNVSRRSVQHAASVQERGVDALQRAVERGLVSVAAAAALARFEAEEQARVLARDDVANLTRFLGTAVKKLAREKRETALAERQSALPDKRYGVILADPEWRFEPWSRDSGMDRAADNHYPTSPTDAICARPVASIAADDCVLFLWATEPMLEDALKVIAAWGFQRKSGFVWQKLYPGDGHGTGYWNWNEHEHLLVATRGTPPAPAPGLQWRSVIEAPVGRHSEKPARVYDLIEAYFPRLAKIELNARAARPGWDAWGLEAPAAEAEAENGSQANPAPAPTTSVAEAMRAALVADGAAVDQP